MIALIRLKSKEILCKQITRINFFAGELPQSAAVIDMRDRISLPGLYSTNSQTKQSSVPQRSLLLSFHSIWRLGFLSVPLLYGTTFLPFAFCWVILSRNCNEFKTDTSRIRGGKEGGEILPLEKLDGFAPWTKHSVTNFAVILCRCIITTSGKMMASYLEDNFSEELY